MSNLYLDGRYVSELRMNNRTTFRETLGVYELVAVYSDGKCETVFHSMLRALCARVANTLVKGGSYNKKDLDDLL